MSTELQVAPLSRHHAPPLIGPPVGVLLPILVSIACGRARNIKDLCRLISREIQERGVGVVRDWELKLEEGKHRTH